MENSSGPSMQTLEFSRRYLAPSKRRHGGQQLRTFWGADSRMELPAWNLHVRRGVGLRRGSDMPRSRPLTASYVVVCGLDVEAALT